MTDVYQLKISLARFKPPLWRRVLVEPDMTLKQLHLLIQLLFEWNGHHLHEFRRFLKIERYNREIFDVEDYMNYQSEYEKATRRQKEDQAIKDLLKEVKEKLEYNYDLGASWNHIIELEKIVPRKENETYPFVSTGRELPPYEDISEEDHDLGNFQPPGKFDKNKLNEVNEKIKKKMDRFRLNTPSQGDSLSRDDIG